MPAFQQIFDGMSQSHSLDSSGLFSGIRSALNARFKRWVNRRLQPKRRQELNNKSLFIFPSKAGFGFLLLIIMLWLMGTNYENNMVLGLAFFLVALLLVCIHHTFFNVSGLQLEYLRSTPCFEGEEGEVELLVSCRSKAEKESIELGFENGSTAEIDLLDEKQLTVKLFTPALHRGWFRPGRITVSSNYPLGIIRCWSYPNLGPKVLVYPRPLAGFDIPVSNASEQEGNLLDEKGSEDFHGFKRHHDGMSPRHIAWKQYARGQGLLSKDYVAYREQQLRLDWESLDGLATEQRLSVLCYWALKIAATQQLYGLRMPDVDIPPGTGVEHKHAVLKALALYGIQESDGD